MDHRDTYYVAVKIFLLDAQNNFLIIKDVFGDWDIPGGRLREQDFNTPLEEVIERKILEELGEKVQYKLQKPVVFMRHERDELLQSGMREKRRIFAVGYSAQYGGGEIVLGESHELYKWVSIEKFKPEDYFAGGWLEGVQEFQEIFNKEL